MEINQSGIKFNGNKAGGNNPKKIIVHHAESSNCSVYDIDRWHKNNGWCGIGYHYFIRKDGSIWTGRPEDWTGAHCIPDNTSSIGICLEGRLGQEEVTPVQYDSLLHLIKDIESRRGKLPVYGHKERDNTDCPGNFPLNKLRADLEGEIKPNPTTKYGQVINVSSYLNVRETPNGKIIGKIFPNEKVEIKWVDSDHLGWYYIRYKVDGTNRYKEGFVSSKYLKRI